MNYFEESLKLHEERKGKISITSKVKVETRDDLSLAYTQGLQNLAEKFMRIKKTSTNIHRKEI